jgi:probable rRNA maturation factor
MNATAVSAPSLATCETTEDLEPPERFTASLVEEAGDWSWLASPKDAVAETASALARHPSCIAARGCEASVVLGDDELLRALNRSYRGKDAPTNVLTFPFQAPPGAGPSSVLGDVVLAAETLGREAADQAIPIEHHFRHLVVHGFLHLLGFDHETDADAAVMERVEVEILAVLGIADPYAADLTKP